MPVVMFLFFFFPALVGGVATLAFLFFHMWWWALGAFVAGLLLEILWTNFLSKAIVI